MWREKETVVVQILRYSPVEYGRPILICKLIFSLEDSSFDSFIGIKVTDSLNHELLDLKGQ